MKVERSPTVSAWIADYQSSHPWRKNAADCSRCGWPHDPHVLCGRATFGQVRLGYETYYIDGSNVDFMLGFVKGLGPGFHWKNDIFFDVLDDIVTVTSLWAFNGCPQKRVWKIPVAEWRSISDFVASRTAPPAPLEK